MNFDTGRFKIELFNRNCFKVRAPVGSFLCFTARDINSKFCDMAFWNNRYAFHIYTNNRGTRDISSNTSQVFCENYIRYEFKEIEISDAKKIRRFFIFELNRSDSFARKIYEIDALKKINPEQINIEVSFSMFLPFFSKNELSIERWWSKSVLYTFRSFIPLERVGRRNGTNVATVKNYRWNYLCITFNRMTEAFSWNELVRCCNVKCSYSISGHQLNVNCIHRRSNQR